MLFLSSFIVIIANAPIKPEANANIAIGLNKVCPGFKIKAIPIKYYYINKYLYILYND